MTREEVLHILYLIAVFYSDRLRFITGDGGLIILLKTNQKDNVNAAYYNILRNFDWAGDETSMRVSELQHVFISKDKKEDPYVQFKFVNDVKKQPSLQKSGDELENWLKIDNNKHKVEGALNHFIKIFEGDIDKVYSAWET
jgi:hypothetical protein